VLATIRIAMVASRVRERRKIYSVSGSGETCTQPIGSSASGATGRGA
jgi:hypothetical protein